MSEEQTDLVEQEEDVYNITALKPKQQRFIHLYVTGQYTQAQLADLLNIHINTIHNWLRKPEMKKIITDFQKDEHEIVESGLKALRHKAINKMSKLIQSPIDGVAYQASKDILDRTGHKQAQKLEVNKTVVTYEKQMKELIDETIEDEAIDVEYEETE